MHKIKKQPCHICNNHKDICELHHLVSLSEASEYIKIAKPDNREIALALPRVWLCPNHHAYFHYIFSKRVDFFKPIHLSLQEMSQYISIVKIKLEWYKSVTISFRDLYSKEQIDEINYKRVIVSIEHNSFKTRFQLRHLEELFDIYKPYEVF